MRKVITPVNAEGRAKLGLRAGDTVRVVQNIIELKKGRGTDKKEKTIKNARKQTFEGLVLSVKHGKESGGMFTVRATLSGVGVEKTFPLYSPVIDSIEIVKRSRVRRAKLYFIREKAAKAVRRQLPQRAYDAPQERRGGPDRRSASRGWCRDGRGGGRRGGCRRSVV